jgi:formylglycine-generating enzyme
MKTKLNDSLLALVLFLSVHCAFGQVTNLGIAPAGGQFVLYWAASTTNYVLQTVTDLNSTNWVTARTAFAANAVVVTNAAPNGYFRLMPTTTPADMALIPAGWFTIGNSIGDSDLAGAPPTNVYVSAFVMDVNLVNYSLWTNVYAYASAHGYSFANTGGGSGTNYPVVGVDWYDCLKWSNARSQQAGLLPVYYTDATFTQLFTNGDSGITVYQNLSVNGFRLPTEAEWEKAARGGGIGRRFPWGNLISPKQAQYFAMAGYGGYDLGPLTNPSGPSPVGSFDVNGYGLYDMAGNVLQWCWDWYASQYTTGSPYLGGINPTGADSGLGTRAQRGGYFAFSANLARCANRFGNIPYIAKSHFGFRCVRGL